MEETIAHSRNTCAISRVTFAWGEVALTNEQRDLRRAAAREFQQSLDQLGRNVQQTSPSKARTAQEAAIDEVLADIEQFIMQQRKS